MSQSIFKRSLRQLIAVWVIHIFFFVTLAQAQNSIYSVGITVPPLSPFDPQQPFIVYADGATLALANVATLAHANGGNNEATNLVLPLQQRLMAHSERLGIYPHLPIDAEDTERLVDFNPRWAKSFDNQFLDGNFYMGAKNTLMTALHRNHIRITSGLRAFLKALEDHPKIYLPEFGDMNTAGTFTPSGNADFNSLKALEDHPIARYTNGLFQTPRDQLTDIMEAVWETHRLLEGILLMPPASIDPDLMLDWVDSVNLGPRLQTPQSRGNHPHALRAANADQTRGFISTYCATEFLPFLAVESARRNDIALDELRTPGILHALHDHTFRSIPPASLQLPAFTSDRDADTDPSAPTLLPVSLSFPPSTASGSTPGLQLARAQDLIPAEYLTDSVNSLLTAFGIDAEEAEIAEAVRGGTGATDLDKYHFTPLAMEVLKTAISKIIHVAPAIRGAEGTGQKTIQNIKNDLSALISFYLSRQELEQDRVVFDIKNPSVINNLWTHNFVRGRYADFDALSATIEHPLAHISHHIHMGNYALCKAIAYQNFYDSHLTKQDRIADRAAADWDGPPAWQINLSREDTRAMLAYRATSVRRPESWDASARLFQPFQTFSLLRPNWGYFFDLIRSMGRIPTAGGGDGRPTYGWASGENLTQRLQSTGLQSDFDRPVIPGLIESPFITWIDLHQNLIHKQLDLTTLGAVDGASLADGDEFPGSWLIQSSPHHDYGPQPLPHEMTRDYLNQMHRVGAMDSLKEASLYLFRNRTGFTPTEKYLFLMTYFKSYLTPLAHLFASFTTDILNTNNELYKLTRFVAPASVIDADLISMLRGEWMGREDLRHSFVQRASLPETDWQFTVNPESDGNRNLVISFLDPVLSVLRTHQPVESATDYGRLQSEIAKIRRYLTTRMEWCWNTPRQAFGLLGPDDQIATLATPAERDSEDNVGDSASNQTPLVNVRAYAGGRRSPYMFPVKDDNEVFPLVDGVTYRGETPQEKASERDMWLHAMCQFPKFAINLLEGYADMAAQYQRAMAIMLHIEFFEKKRHRDASHLTYLDMLEPRAITHDLSHASPDFLDQHGPSGINRTHYAEIVRQYNETKRAYTDSFTTIQSFIDGAFQTNFTAEDYTKAIEFLYLYDANFGKLLSNAATKWYNDNANKPVENEPQQSEADREWPARFPEKFEPDMWDALHEEFNKITGTYTVSSPDPRITELASRHSFECRPKAQFSERHLVFQNKLACQLQKKAVYRYTLTKTLAEYNHEIKSFLDGLPTNVTKGDEFEALIQWSADKFKAYLDDEKMGRLDKQIESLAADLNSAESRADGDAVASVAHMLNPDSQKQDKLSWEDAVNEINRVKFNTAVNFFENLVHASPLFRSSVGDHDTRSLGDVLGSNLKAYTNLAANSFDGAGGGQTVNDVPLLYWFFGPNMLFESPKSGIADINLSAYKYALNSFQKLIPPDPDIDLPENINDVFAFESDDDDNNHQRGLYELLHLFDHQILKSSLGNIFNAKLMLGAEDPHYLQPLTKDFNDHIGGLGSIETLHRHFMGHIDVYDRVAPFDFTVFMFNRASPTMQKWRAYVQSKPLLAAFDTGLFTQIGPRYQYNAYSENEDSWPFQATSFVLNTISGFFGKDPDPNAHTFMHKLFCRVGHSLKGGGLWQDPAHQRTPNISWWPQDVFAQYFNDVSALWREENNAIRHGGFDWIAAPERPGGGDQETLGAYWQDYYKWYCDLFHMPAPPTRQFTPAERETIRVYETRLAAARQEMDETPESKDGAIELKNMIGSKYYESALLWTFVELMSTYVMEPYMKAGIELQKIFANLDYEIRLFLGHYQGLDDRISPSWEYGFFDKLIEGRNPFRGLDGGLLDNFALRALKPLGDDFDLTYVDPRYVYQNHYYTTLMNQLMGRLHLRQTLRLPQGKTYVINKNDRVDVPVRIHGQDNILNFLHGGDADLFQRRESDLMNSFLGRGDTGPEDSTHRCLTDIAVVAEALLPNGEKLNEVAFAALDSEAQTRYLDNVAMYNTLAEYADYLEYEDDRERKTRPGFCYLKKLTFNAAYQLLVEKQKMDHLIATREADDETHACGVLLDNHKEELKYAVGLDTVSWLEDELKRSPNTISNDYCQYISNAFLGVNLFKRLIGYGLDSSELSDLAQTLSPATGDPAPDAPPTPTAEDPHQLNLLMAYEKNMSSLQMFQGDFITMIASKYPQLDRQVPRDDDATFSGIFQGFNRDLSFIQRAFSRIVDKHSPYANGVNELASLVRQVTNHSGPFCEFLNAHIVQSEDQEAFLSSPEMKQQLIYNANGTAYLASTSFCGPLEKESLSTYTQSRAAHLRGDDLQKGAESPSAEQYNRQVIRRHNAAAASLARAFPWMLDKSMGQHGEIAPTLSNWVAHYTAQGPSEALYEYTQANKSSKLAGSISKFLRDEDEHIGYTGILKASIRDNLNSIKIAYNQSHQVKSDLETLPERSPLAGRIGRKNAERASLYNVLVQRFSVPELYNSIRRQLGPANERMYDKYYYFFVPAHVWESFKGFEEYQAVVAAFTSTMFVMQMLISMNPFMFMDNVVTRPLTAIINRGLPYWASVILSTAFAATLAVWASGTIFSWAGFQFFKIFGADWAPIRMAFTSATLLSALFMGLARFQPISIFFKAITPTLKWMMSVGWYVFVMDIFMYFGDKVTWDFATQQYGYFKTLFDTYITRKSLEIRKGSAVSDLLKREQAIIQNVAGDLTSEFGNDYAPMVPEYRYIKHLQQTTTTALSYLWFGLYMGVSMDFSQLRTSLRYRGLHLLPNYQSLTNLVPNRMAGVVGQLNEGHMRNIGTIQRAAAGGGNLRHAVASFSDTQFRHTPMPEPVRMSWMTANLCRALARASSSFTWTRGAENVRGALNDAFNNPKVEGILRTHWGEQRYNGMRSQLNREIGKINAAKIQEIATSSAYQFRTPALVSALAAIQKDTRVASAFFDAFAGSVDSLPKINTTRFTDNLAHHTAMAEAIHANIERFRSFKKAEVMARGEARRALGRDPSVDEMRAWITNRIMMTTDWKQVSKELEFQFIRYFLWNNHMMYHVRRFTTQPAKKAIGQTLSLGARTVGFSVKTALILPSLLILPQTRRIAKDYYKDLGTSVSTPIARAFKLMKNQGHRVAARFHRPDQNENLLTAALGVTPAKIIGAKKNADFKAYQQHLIEDVPMHEESLRAVISELSRDPAMRYVVEQARTILNDYDAIQSERAKLDGLLHDPEKIMKIGDIAAASKIIDMHATMIPDAAKLNIVTPVISRLIEVTDPPALLSIIRSIATKLTPMIEKSQWREILSNTFDTSGQIQRRINEAVESGQIDTLFANRPTIKQDVRKFFGAILYKSIQDDSGAIAAPIAAYTQLAMAKRVLTLLFFDHMDTPPQMHLVRLVSPEDITLILRHAGAKTLVRDTLIEGAQKYQINATDHDAREDVLPGNPDQSPLGYKVMDYKNGNYVMEVTANKSFVDGFFGKISPDKRWRPEFGITGPYIVFKTSGSDAPFDAARTILEKGIGPFKPFTTGIESIIWRQKFLNPNMEGEDR